MNEQEDFVFLTLEPDDTYQEIAEVETTKDEDYHQIVLDIKNISTDPIELHISTISQAFDKAIEAKQEKMAWEEDGLKYQAVSFGTIIVK